MSSPASSAWGCLGAALSVEPEGLEGRAAFLELVTVVSAAAAQTKTQVKCNLCDKTFTGITTRMAAHFGKKAGYNVSPCTKSTPAAVALGKKFLSDLGEAREIKRKRAAESAVVKSRQTYLRRKNDGEGKEAADKAFARLLIATGLSFGLGESVYLRDFLDSVIAHPEWQPKNRKTIAKTDLDAEYERVRIESKARLERNGLGRGKALQTDGLTTKQVRAHGKQKTAAE